MAVNIYKNFINKAKEMANGRDIVSINGMPSSFVDYLFDEKIEIPINYSITNPEDIKKAQTKLFDKSDSYFIINLSNEPSSVVKKQLNDLKYTEKDYLFLKHDPIVLTEKTKTPYEDEWGNTVNYIPKNLTITFTGFNNAIKFGENIYFHNESKFLLNTENVIDINNNCDLSCDVNMPQMNSKILIKENVFFNQKIVINNFINSSLKIDSFSRFSGDSTITIMNNFELSIGKNCLFALDLNFLIGDGHAIFDINTKKRINDKNALGSEKSKAVIGDHVWIGYDSVVMAGANIGNGSIIGAKSLVKGKIPNNCIAVGSPAKIVRKNICWTGDFAETDISKCDPFINLTEE